MNQDRGPTILYWGMMTLCWFVLGGLAFFLVKGLSS